METTEELNTLLASIEKEVSSDTPVYLYLPAVTYDGEITFGDHVWQIFGSTDGDATTTFTGTVNVNGKNGNYGIMSGLPEPDRPEHRPPSKSPEACRNDPDPDKRSRRWPHRPSAYGTKKKQSPHLPETPVELQSQKPSFSTASAP